MRIIKILILTLIVLLPSAIPVMADGGEASHEEKEVDGYKVKLAFVEGDVQVGHNKLNLEIEDNLGQPLGDAKVTVIAELYSENGDTSAEDLNEPSGEASPSGMDMHSDKKPGAEKETSVEAPIRTVTAEMEAGHKAGEYEGELDLEEAGHWMIKVVFMVQSQEKVAEFLADVRDTPNGRVILLSFLGINAGIISVAAITRRKSVDTPVLKEAE